VTENLEELQTIEKLTERLTLYSFIDVMTTANKFKEAYRKLYPDASKDQTYEETWGNIKQLKGT
jgi:hypothetical protein